MYNGWCTLTQSTNEKFNYLSPHHSFPICCLMSGPMYTLEVWWRMKIWWLLIKASINVNIGWTRLPNPLFCSLLESATKPIDKDEEESYRAAFAGEQKVRQESWFSPPSVWLEPQWSDLPGLTSGGERDLVMWNSHIGADNIGSTHSNQKTKAQTLNWTKRLIATKSSDASKHNDEKS